MCARWPAETGKVRTHAYAVYGLIQRSPAVEVIGGVEAQALDVEVVAFIGLLHGDVAHAGRGGPEAGSAGVYRGHRYPWIADGLLTQALGRRRARAPKGIGENRWLSEEAGLPRPGVGGEHRGSAATNKALLRNKGDGVRAGAATAGEDAQTGKGPRRR